MKAARILVVDDNTADIKLLRVALDQHSQEYTLEILTDGEEALTYIGQYRKEAREPEPCIILLDLHLPRHDGIAILRAIRKTPELAHIHVLVLSGMASPRERDTIAGMGAFYRQKPFKLNEYFDLGGEIFALCNGSAEKAA